MFGLCERFGYTPDQVRAMTAWDVDELVRYVNWADDWRNKSRG